MNIDFDVEVTELIDSCFRKSSLKKGKGKRKVNHVKLTEPEPETNKLEEEDTGSLDEVIFSICSKVFKIIYFNNSRF